MGTPKKSDFRKPIVWLSMVLIGFKRLVTHALKLRNLTTLLVACFCSFKKPPSYFRAARGIEDMIGEDVAADTSFEALLAHRTVRTARTKP